MKWLNKNDMLKKFYESNDNETKKRTVKKFLFLPKNIDGVVKWLEIVTISQYLVCYSSLWSEYEKYVWDDWGWVEDTLDLEK